MKKLIFYKSSVTDVKHGVPQGSIFGPILFVYFLTIFENYAVQQNLLISSDTSIRINVSLCNALQIKLNNNLTNISKYFNKNNLLLNFYIPRNNFKINLFHNCALEHLEFLRWKR